MQVLHTETRLKRVKNDRLLRALTREPVDRTPVWLMRQAGRYLPEYRDLRARTGDFLSLCKTPELACEVTVQPLRRFPLDAAILFSDILTIPDAMGLGLSVEEGVGPKFERVLRSAHDIRALGVPDPEADLGYVMDTIRLVRRELDGSVPLIGFAGSPWTLATYMVEGGGSRDFRLVKTLMYGEPSLLRVLLAKLSEAVIVYLNAQIAAGAQAVMVFDTWGGILSTADFSQFSLCYLAQVVAGLNRSVDGCLVPVIVFTKGGSRWLGLLAETGCDALGLDWTIDIAEARREVGTRVALQGNLDPTALFAPPDRIRAEVASLLERFGAGGGHVFNLGHGVMPEVEPENVAVLIDAVHELSKPWHKL